MKILADENTPRTVIEALRDYEYDVLWIKENHRGMADDEILRLSIPEKRIVLTFDKDFGELVYRLRIKNTHGVILVRIADNQISIQRILEILEIYKTEIEGYFIVLEEQRIRRRKLPDD
jgi:predicted nuclease of predicted toxin-antitoxin system